MGNNSTNILLRQPFPQVGLRLPGDFIKVNKEGICFKITSETALATGTRRIVAVSGPEAIKLFQSRFGIVKTLSEIYKAKPEEVLEAVTKQQENYSSDR